MATFPPSVGIEGEGENGVGTFNTPLAPGTTKAEEDAKERTKAKREDLMNMVTLVDGVYFNNAMQQSVIILMMIDKRKVIVVLSY